jgi:hypothetical protein
VLFPATILGVDFVERSVYEMLTKSAAGRTMVLMANSGYVITYSDARLDVRR